MRRVRGGELGVEALLRSFVGAFRVYSGVHIPAVELFVRLAGGVLPPRLQGRRDVAAAGEGWGVRLARARARLAKAWRLLGEGVGDEAGEEAWRAAVDAVNAAAAAAWGVEARSHRALKLMVAELYRIGLDIRSEFGVAEALHNNYYDPGHPPETLQAMIANVERLVDKVEEWVQRRAALHTPLQPQPPTALLNIVRDFATITIRGVKHRRI